MSARQPAHDNLAGSYQHSEITSRIDLRHSTVVKTRLLSFNRMQSTVVTGLLNGYDTLRRHLYIMGLLDSPVCRRCEAQEWTSPHILASIRHTSDTEFLFLGPSGYQKSKSGGNLELIKGTGLP